MSDAERKLAAIITNIRRVDGPPNSRRCALMTKQFSSPWPPAHRIPLPHWRATVGPAAFHLSFSGNPVPTRARSLNDPARPFANWMIPPSGREARRAGRQRASGAEKRWTSAPRRGRAGTILRYRDGGVGRRVRPNAPVLGASSGKSHFRMELESVGLLAITEGLCLEILASGEES